MAVYRSLINMVTSPQVVNHDPCRRTRGEHENRVCNLCRKLNEKDVRIVDKDGMACVVVRILDYLNGSTPGMEREAQSDKRIRRITND